MEPERTTYEAKSAPSAFSELVRFSILALIVVIPIRLFIAQPFIVSGASMEPTFENGQYLIVDQLSYRFDEPLRGDVVVFRWPRDPSKFFIKRIIGLPGEIVTIEGKEVTIFNKVNPDGFILREQYIADMNSGTSLTEVLGDNEYFVMGDNRNQSSDSRTWGVLPQDLIVGRAFLRLLPITSAEVLPGSVRDVPQ